MGHYFFVLWRKQKTWEKKDILLSTIVTSESINSEYKAEMPRPCIKAILEHSMPALFKTLIKN